MLMFGGAERKKFLGGIFVLGEEIVYTIYNRGLTHEPLFISKVLTNYTVTDILVI